jgi:hypothetical protein
MNITKDKINLLWTGGWDSTFQLLQLLLIYRSSVTPYYLIDSGRKSLGIELKTMELIKEILFEEYPYTKKLLDPIHYADLEEIIPDSDITNAFQEILREKQIGLQYERIARLCKELGINDMQLSIEKSVIPDTNHWDHKIDQYLTKETINAQTVYKIDPKFKTINEFIIFRYFVFPLIYISKNDMLTISNEQGWRNIMNKTWFCHNPTCNKQPCGKCKPCLLVIKDNFGWRIKPIRRLISIYYRKVFWPAKSNLKLILTKFGLFNPK